MPHRLQVILPQAWVTAIQGGLAVALFIEEGELGSTSGGPVMKSFLDGLAGSGQ